MNISSCRSTSVACLVMSLMTLGACQVEDNDFGFAEADITPVSNGAVSGIVRFSNETGYIHVTGTLEGLEAGVHDVLLYENAQCDNLAMAGSESREAGAPKPGDIASVTANPRGQGTIDNRRTDVAGTDVSTSLVGHSVVVMAADAEVASGCGVVRAIPDIDYTL